MKQAGKQETLEKTHDLLAQSRRLLRDLDRQMAHTEDDDADSEATADDHRGHSDATYPDNRQVKKPR
jgi:hypothetical protein